jgi:hypothetical protein
MKTVDATPAFGVVKGKPEEFVVVWRKDYLIVGMDFHSEEELRAICKRGGMAESDIAYLIGEARKHPV